MSKHIHDTEAAHRAAVNLGTGWENITAFGAAINGTPIVAIAADLYTTLQTAAEASVGKTDLGVMLAHVAANASPINDPAAIGPTHEITLHPPRSPAVTVRIEPFIAAAGKLYYRLVPPRRRAENV